MTGPAIIQKSPSLTELFDAATVPELREIVSDPSDEKITRFCREIELRLWPGVSIQPTSPAELRYQLLRYIADEDRSRIPLQALADTPPSVDPDQIVLKLWQTFDDDFVTGVHLSKRYHQQRLFAWFVDRYDLRRARQIYTNRPWLHSGLQVVPIIGAPLILLLVHRPGIALPLILAAYVVPTLVWWMNGLPPFDFTQSLIPRLAGTAAAGAALMLSSSDLVAFLLQQSLPASLLLLVPAVVYLGLEIQHRVRPRLRFREVINRVSNVVFLALAHAAGIVVFVMPVIRHLLIAGKTIAPNEDLSLTGLFAMTTAVFTAGLVLNVIWAEEPITRPL